jgi:predicted RND superfamily exporter protein
LRLVTLVLFALAGAGLLHVTTSIQIMRLFGQGHSVLASYAWLEERLGGLVPMEIVLHYDQQQASSTIARLHLVEDLEASLRSLPDVRGCLSAATFTPRVPSAGLWIRRFATEKMIVRARPRLLDSGFLADHGAGEAWRVSTRLASSGDPDYGLLHQQLLAHTQRFLAARQREQGELPRVTITGAVPILFKARRSLLSGMSLGLLLDVALVCVAVAVLLRRISLALLLAVVCLLPVAMVFGAMGLLGIVVDIGSVMAPCVALGVTVDDVIHWLLWYQRGQSQGLTASRAIELAHARCAPAMVQSWGVIGLGLTVFTLSPFVPTFRFGLLMVLLLTVNLVGNLVLLPALVPQRKALEA